MLRLSLFALALLSACSTPDPAPSAGPAPDAPSPEPATEDRLPAALLGTYDTDAAACAQGMTMARLTIRPDTLAFYYGYATVDAVATHDGGYQVETTLSTTEGVEEVVPEPASYRIERTADGLRIESAYAGSAALVRCGEPRTDGGAADGGDEASGVESVYTEIAGCTTLETFEEGGGSVQRCPGARGVPLFVSLGDLRYDVDAGVRNDSWDTPSGFNALGTTVEWRLRDGAPFAVIVRYEIEGPGGTPAERRSDLAVIAVGREGRPGCLVGYVPASARPDQNTAARRLADREAADACAG